MVRRCRRALLVGLVVGLLASILRSQTSGPVPAAAAASTAPAATATTTETAETAPATLPASVPAGAAELATTQSASRPSVEPPPATQRTTNFASFYQNVEKTSATTRAIAADLAADPMPERLASALPPLLQEVHGRSEESSQLLNAAPSLDTVNTMEADWQNLSSELTDFNTDLQKRTTQLDGKVQTLSQYYVPRWDNTPVELRDARAPDPIIAQAQSIRDSVRTTLSQVEARRNELATYQTRVSDAQQRVDDTLAAIASARKAARDRLFTLDSPPIWDVEHAGGLAVDSRQSFAAQWDALEGYASRKQLVFLIHAALLVGLVPVFHWVRNRVRPWAQEDASLKQVAAAFDLPVATAVVVALLMSAWFYPHAPRMLWAIVVAGALAPAILILRRLLAPGLRPLLYALVVFFTVDQLRYVAASQPLLYRLLMIAEMGFGTLFVMWVLRSGRLSAALERVSGGLTELALIVTRLFGVVFLVAGLATVIGCVSLGKLLGNAALGSAYLAVILYAASRIGDGLVMSGLRVRPVSLLAAVREHRKLVWQRILLVLHWGTVALWVILTLEMLTIREPVFGLAAWILVQPVGVGAFSISLSQLLQFVGAIWGAFLLSRFIRFLLEEDVYPRVTLARGLPYAISTVLHYAILLVGFVTAVRAIDRDNTRFTILAGAFGVGLGFGLQNIFNNFISGLILLFERPIKVGDVVQVGPDTGMVRRIGIRASVIRLATGAELIVPNGRFISDPVTNWTLSSHGRSIELPLAVAPTTEPRQVQLLWKRVTLDNKQVAEDPPPTAMISGIAGGSMNFELRAWTNDFDKWAQTRSDLTIAMSAALMEAGIGVK